MYQNVLLNSNFKHNLKHIKEKLLTVTRSVCGRYKNYIYPESKKRLNFYDDSENIKANFSKIFYKNGALKISKKWFCSEVY